MLPHGWPKKTGDLSGLSFIPQPLPSSRKSGQLGKLGSWEVAVQLSLVATSPLFTVIDGEEPNKHIEPIKPPSRLTCCPVLQGSAGLLCRSGATRFFVKKPPLKSDSMFTGMGFWEGAWGLEGGFFRHKLQKQQPPQYSTVSLYSDSVGPRVLALFCGWDEELGDLSGLSFIPQPLPSSRTSGRLGNWEVGKLLCNKA